MKKNKQAQQSDPQVANVEALIQQVQEAGLSLQEDIGIWTPEQIIVWADELGFQADQTLDSCPANAAPIYPYCVV